MPTYGYKCDSCGHQFEVVQSIRDEPLKECPVCGAKLRKLLYPVGVVFKGSGFHNTDYKRGASAGPSSSEGGGDSGSSSPSESKPAASGESKPAASGDSKAVPAAPASGSSSGDSGKASKASGSKPSGGSGMDS